MATRKIESLRVMCCGPTRDAPLGAADARTLADGFAALGDPVRLQLLGLIAGGEDDGVCVCDLVEPVGKSQPTVSHHLKTLRDANLIVGDRRGTWVYYRIVPEQLALLRAALA
jgi:ArsR family transcriptional regulator, arsenate/arsenite/antimonite-responsive transcriptional repressor